MLVTYPRRCRDVIISDGVRPHEVSGAAALSTNGCDVMLGAEPRLQIGA